MADRQSGGWLGSAGLIAIGFILGSIWAPQSSDAQQGGTQVGNDYVVIQGYTNADGPIYYLVRGDGKARPISNGRKEIIKVPESTQMKVSVDHAFSKAILNLNHSGSIAK